MNDTNRQVPQATGAIAFSPEGILFIGDNKAAAIFAFDTGRGDAPASLEPFTFEHIDETLAKALGARANALIVNGMAVHPTTREPYVSLGVRDGDHLRPAVVRVSLDGVAHNFDLAATSSVHHLSDAPDADVTFQSRAGQWPVPAASYYDAKARTPVRSMTVVDLKFHDGEVYVAGVSNQEFSSTLRRIPYPFTGTATTTRVEIYHLAHGMFETRAPIRAMSFASVDGVDTLVAAYACSPLVTIPVADLRDGARVTGKTIGDMGNGQPISIVPYRENDEAKLFITNLARGPMSVTLDGLAGAEGYTPENRPASGFLVDTSPHMPAGPVGKQVLFIGSSLRADLFSDRFFVSLTRYPDDGQLVLETLPVGPLPARLDKIWVEFDFPGFRFPAAA